MLSISRVLGLASGLTFRAVAAAQMGTNNSQAIHIIAVSKLNQEPRLLVPTAM